MMSKGIHVLANVALAGAIGLTVCGAANATVVTGFDEGTLNPGVHLDVPAGSPSTVTLNSAGSGSLDFRTTGNTDMWLTRNYSPFAWSARPDVSIGDTWWVETRLTLPGNTVGRLAGITFYGNQDGLGGYNDGLDFHFGIDQWGPSTWLTVQGLGDNRPGNLGSNIVGPYFGYYAYNPTISLRTEITENGIADHYNFFYRYNDSQAWSLMGSMDSVVDNARAAIFLKSYQPGTASFDYFNVGPVASSSDVPEPASLALVALGLVGVAGARRRRQGA
jgi:hypothetical protein